MEGQDRDSKQNRSKQRQVDDHEEDHPKESRKKEDRKKKDKTTTARQKVRPPPVQTGGSGGQVPPRYHHREVPPRFQQQKQTKHQKYSKTNQHSVNKKPLKESNRWHQQQPSSTQPHVHHQSQHHQPSHRHRPQPTWADDDGGWSSGVPEKGSGWSAGVEGTPLDIKSQDTDWGIASPPDGSAASTGRTGGGGNWLSADSRQSDPETWRSISPSGHSRHSQNNNWMSDNDGSQSTGENETLPSNETAKAGTTAATSSSTSSDSAVNTTTTSKSSWGVSTNWKLPDSDPIGDDLERELARELDYYAGSSLDADKGEFGSGGRGTQEGGSDWDELDAASLSSSDRDTQILDEAGHSGKSSQETTNVINPFSDGQRNPSNETKTTNLDIRDNPEPLDHGAVNAEGYSSVWRSGRGSTSSVNSVGSNSSKKSGEGKGPRVGYQNKGSSPRKPGRFDSSSTSQSVLSGNGTNSVGRGMKIYNRTRKVVELEDALESLQSEPSGWGDLPSPNIQDADDGTALWGVPPDDQQRRHSKGRGSASAGWGEPSGGGGGGGGGDWGEDDSGVLTAGWGKDSSNKPPSRGLGQWDAGSPDTWTTIPTKQKDKSSGYAENLKKLVDMGFTRSASEKYLKSNNNDIDAAIGDLLAVSALGDEELANGMAVYHLQNNKANRRNGKQLPGSGGMTFPSTLSTAANPVTGIPSTGTSTVSNSSAGITPLYSQLASIHAQMFPPSQQTQALQNQLLLQQMHLLQMQQRYLMGGVGGAGVFPGVPSLQNYQQLLTQHLAQLHLLKQQLTQQLQHLKSSGQSIPQQQVITLRLQTISAEISQVNQQLVLLSQLSTQQKELAAKNPDGKLTPTGMGSPQIGRNTPPIRNKSEPKLSSLPTALSRSHSVGGDMSKNLPYNMQGLTINGPPPPSSNISQTSARSVSRLQQIISGSSTSDNLPAPANKTERQITVTSPIGPPETLNLGPVTTPVLSQVHPISSGAGNATPTSTALFPPQKSVDEIQEFRPGVLWQPRAQPTEPAQVYAKQAPSPVPPMDWRMNTNTAGPFFTQSPMKPNTPPYQFPQPAPVTGKGGAKHLTRQHSGGGMSYYGTYPPPISSQTGVKYNSLTRNNRQSWNPPMPDARRPPPFQNQSRAPSYPARRGSQGSSSRIPGGPTSGAFGRNQPPLPTTQSFGFSNTSKNRMPPLQTPTSTSYLYKGGFVGGPASTPPPTAFTPTSTSSNQMINAGNKKWGPIVGDLAGSSTWGSERSNPKWDQDWSHPPQGSGEGTPSYISPPPSSAGSYGSLGSAASVDSFNAGRSAMWSQEGLMPSHIERTILSPEPTFAEWQAGKKARLSVFKLPANPPSIWLMIRNVTSQVDEPSLRDVCSEYGMVQSCVISPALESALIRYNTKEEAMQAKTGLDKNPTICGVSVVVDFASELDIDGVFDKLSVSKNGVGDSMSNTLEEATPEWFTKPIGAETDDSAKEEPLKPPQWDDPGVTFTAHTRDSTDAGTPSLWSDSAFLPGLASPWHNIATNREGDDLSNIGGSPSLSTYLPNGLL